jgi:hypothetical protein
VSTAVSIWKHKRQQKWKYKAASKLRYEQLGGPDGPVSVGPPQPLVPKFISFTSVILWLEHNVALTEGEWWPLVDKMKPPLAFEAMKVQRIGAILANGTSVCSTSIFSTVHTCQRSEGSLL